MSGPQQLGNASLETLIEECDDFQRCASCGRTVVQLSTHTCPTPPQGGVASREKRERRAARDDRDEDDLVGVYRRANGNTYAYHELDEELEPRCPTRNPTKAQKFEVLTRTEAKAMGRAPCGHCRRVD